MNHSVEILKRLEEHSPAVRFIAQQCQKYRAQRPSPPLTDAQAIHARIQHLARNDKISIVGDERKQVWESHWRWLEGLKRTQQDLHGTAEYFARRCQAQVKETALREEALPIFVERMQRALVGVVDVFERRMPKNVRWEKVGHVRIEWRETVESVDGDFQWVEAGQSAKYPLLKPTLQAFDSYAEIRQPDNLICARQLLVDLRDRQVKLPSFEFCKESNQTATVLQWRRREVAPVSSKEAPSVPAPTENLLPLYLEFELSLWDKRTEAAEMLDAAICAAVSADVARGCQPGGPGTELATVVHWILTVTEFSKETVDELLESSLLSWPGEKPVAGECTPSRAALEFLLDQVKGS
jgi:hypothetical protein